MKKIIVIAPFAVIAVVAVILILNRSGRILGPGTGPDVTSAGNLKTYTLTDISSHNSRNDCWMAIDGKVYDVTVYIPGHPGGETILAGCGKDATDLFNGTNAAGKPHPAQARSLLDNYLVGSLSQ